MSGGFRIVSDTLVCIWSGFTASLPTSDDIIVAGCACDTQSVHACIRI